MTQTLSEMAQQTTIAYSGLAFITGEKESYTFLPPGKLSDYFGFQYMRDNDPDEMGHNTDFVPKSANNMLSLLTYDQKNEIIDLAKDQVSLINNYGFQRFPLIDAFSRLLRKEMPDGSIGLDSTEVKNFSAEIFNIDGVISYQRAKLFGRIYQSLSQIQKDTLDGLFAVGMLDWPDLPDQVDKQSMSHDEHVAVMTYASEMFAWFAGSVEADVYFCPERQATYFGGFYKKDIPAMGNPNYTIGANITQEKGSDFINALDETQKKYITDIVKNQLPVLHQIVEIRTEISEELRKFKTGENVDSLKVINLSEEYGRMDGSLAYIYATAFANVCWSSTEDQADTLMELRDLDDYPAVRPFLFSEPIDWPFIINTDFFFKFSTGLDIHESDKFQFEIFPNPLTEKGTFLIQLEEKQKVKIVVQNINGQIIQYLDKGNLLPGKHEIRWDIYNERLPPGIYFCSLISQIGKKTIKILIQ